MMTESMWLNSTSPIEMLKEVSYDTPGRENRISREATTRQLRLIAVGFYRSSWWFFRHPKSRELIERCEKLIETEPSCTQLTEIQRQLRQLDSEADDIEYETERTAVKHCLMVDIAVGVSKASAINNLENLHKYTDPNGSKRCNIIKDVLGNVFEPELTIDDKYITKDVYNLAKVAYEERYSFQPYHSGFLVNDNMLVLADVLEIEVNLPQEVEVKCRLCEGTGVVVSSTGDEYGCIRCNTETHNSIKKYKKGTGKVWRKNPILTHLRSCKNHVRGCHVLDAILRKGQ